MFKLQGKFFGRWVTIRDEHNEPAIYHNKASAIAAKDERVKPYRQMGIKLRILAKQQ